MDRYSVRRGKRQSVGQTPGGSMVKLRAALLLLLTVALAASLIVGVPAVNAKRSTHAFVIDRLANECSNAYELSQTMSLTAGTDSYEKLARIRSYIHGMEMLVMADKQLVGGAPLLEESVFVSLYGQIERYNNQLITGMSTSAQLTDLQNSLEALLQQVSRLMAN